MGDSSEVCALAGYDSELDSLRRTFYDEADERLLELEALLLELDGRPVDSDRINSVFRAVHSIKGGSAACELVEVVRFAHTFESLLDALRKERMTLNAEVIDVMLQSSDVLSALVRSSQSGSGNADERGVSAAVERIRRVLERATAPRPSELQQRELSTSGVMFFEEDVVATSSVSEVAAASGAVTTTRHPSLRAASISAAPIARLPPPEPMPPSATAYDDDASALHASILEADLARMVSLAIDLQQSSTRLTAQLSARECEPAELGETARQIAIDVGELESRLTAARGGDSATLLECIVVRLDACLYAVPLRAIGRYFTFGDESLRTVPGAGSVLVSGNELLPVLEAQFGGLPAQPSPEPHARVAISLVLPSGAMVLLVDEVLTQVKLLVRKLEANYRSVHGILGAAPYGSRVLLVLDVESLARRGRPG